MGGVWVKYSFFLFAPSHLLKIVFSLIILLLSIYWMKHQAIRTRHHRTDPDGASDTSHRSVLSSRQWIKRHRLKYTKIVTQECDLPNQDVFEDHSSLSSLSSSIKHNSDFTTTTTNFSSEVPCRGMELLDDPLHPYFSLFSFYSALLISKSFLLFLISSPISLLTPIGAYALQSVGSRVVDLLLSLVMLLIVFVLQKVHLSMPLGSPSIHARALATEKWFSHPPIPSSNVPESYLDSDIESDSRHSSYDIIVTDPAEKHSLEDLRALRLSSFSHEENDATTKKVLQEMKRSRASKENETLPCARYHFIERDPKEILDDLLTL